LRNKSVAGRLHSEDVFKVRMVGISETEPTCGLNVHGTGTEIMNLYWH